MKLRPLQPKLGQLAFEASFRSLIAFTAGISMNRLNTAINTVKNKALSEVLAAGSERANPAGRLKTK